MAWPRNWSRAVETNPNKIEANFDMPIPSGPAGLVRLLDMGTYLDKFCKNLEEMTRPLRDLLKADSGCANAKWPTSCLLLHLPQ